MVKKRDKSGRGKILVVLTVFIVVVVLAVGVIAQTNSSNASGAGSGADRGLTPEEEQAVIDQVGQIASPALAKRVEDYVKDFAGKRGVKAAKIRGVSQVDFNSLPKAVQIENVDDANLAIYQVDYDDDSSGSDVAKEIYVVSYSIEKLQRQGDLIVAHDKRLFLTFGSSEVIAVSGFLDTSTGVTTSLEAGYVMTRPGSITAVSTNLNVIGTGRSSVEIVVYRNGQAINFGNAISPSSTGVKKDYDVQSTGVVTFEAGDVLSAFVSVDGAVVDDVITMVEITTTG